MSEDAALTCLVAGCGVLGFATAWLLMKRRANWSGRRIALVAAAPVPGIAAVFCAWVFAAAAFDQATAPEICGVDACAMAMAAGFYLLLWAAAAFVLAWLAAKLAVRLAR